MKNRKTSNRVFSSFVVTCMVLISWTRPVLSDVQENLLKNVEYRCLFENDSDIVDSKWKFTNKGPCGVQIERVLFEDAWGRQEYLVDWYLPAFTKDKEFRLKIFALLPGKCEFSVSKVSAEKGSHSAITSVSRIDPKKLRVGAIDTGRSVDSDRSEFLSFHVYNPAAIPIHVSNVRINALGYVLNVPSDFHLEPMSIQNVYVYPQFILPKAKIESIQITEFSQSREEDLPSPEKVAVAFLKAMEDGNIAEARKHVGRQMGFCGSLEVWAEKIRENKRVGFVLKKVEKVKNDELETGEEEKSVVGVTAVYEVKNNEGPETVENVQTVIGLVKENGYWRVRFSKDC